MGSGICGAALVRAANAMLTALGGDQVSLLLPANAMASDAAGQLGLVVLQGARRFDGHENPKNTRNIQAGVPSQGLGASS